MALIYASNQEELEEAFTTLGFVEGTGDDAGKWFFNADTNKIGYFELTYTTSNVATSPIVYHDSSGQTRNLYAQMTSANPILKIEYHELYNGGICFRWQSGTSANIDSMGFVNNMTVAIFANSDSSYSIIFNVANQVNTTTTYFDDMKGITTSLPTIGFSVAPVQTTNAVILAKLYDNRDGILDGEVYSVLTPVPSSTNSYYTIVNNIKYIITFGVGNGSNGRLAFRLADES